MATALLKNSELRIVPLAVADPATLNELLDEQCSEWMNLLHWDYSEPSRIIRQVITGGELSGFAAISGARLVGLAYYVIDGNRCSIGDIYVSKPWRGRNVDRQLVSALVAELDKTPGVRRIESQCVGVGNEGSSQLLEELGLTRFSRLFMLRHVRAEDISFASAEQRNVTIRGWQVEDYKASVRVIQRSYRGQPDSLINSQYRSEAGCAELLTILTDHIWCGAFLPEASLVATMERRQGRHAVTGVLIASRIAQAAGHIGQISVNPPEQGKGYGRCLIEHSLAAFAKLEYDTVSLAVTSANSNALRLYQSLGFQTVHEFPVFCRGRQ